MRQFEALLTAGWAQVDLTTPVADTVDGIVSVMLDGYPTDVAGSLRGHLVQRLRSAMTGLAGGGAIAAYLPVRDGLGAPVRPFIVVRPVSFEMDGEHVAPINYLMALMAQEGTSLVDPPGMVGVKTVSDSDTAGRLSAGLADVPADIMARVDRGGLDGAVAAGRQTRHVHYVIGVPAQDDCWMAVDASVSAPGGSDAKEVLDAVEEFVDAWVTTITWKEASDA